jgi:ABC-type multidrug transport system fused ATPase/permease subunit
MPRKSRSDDEFRSFFSFGPDAPWRAESVRRIWRFLSQLKGLCAVVIAVELITVGMRIIEPWMAKLLFDTSTQGAEIERILTLGGVWIGIYVARTFVGYFGVRTQIQLQTRIVQMLRDHIFDHVMKAPISYFREHSAGYLMSRQLDDTEDLDGILVPDLARGLLALTEFLVILGIMISINWVLSSVMVAVFFLDLRANFLFPLRKAYTLHNESKARQNRELQQSITGVRLIRTSAAEEEESRRYSRFTRFYARIRFLRDNINNRRRTTTSFIQGLSNPLIIVFGGLFVAQGTFTLGNMMAFLLYFNLAQRDLREIIGIVPQFNTGRAYADRIHETLSEPVEQDSGTIAHVSISRGIEFRDVSFGYGNGDVLRDLSFSVEKGQTYAIVGPSGSGKSSVVNLLLRLYHPSSGSILIDSIDINEFTLSGLRRAIGCISQDPFLFNRTIRDNLVYGCTGDVTDAQVWQALDVANAREFVEERPHGIHTLVSDRGEVFSGGQRQRLCIAREILRDPPVLVLDEATSALDAISEEAVRTAIDHASVGRTVIVIAHRIASVRNADVIAVIDDGRIVERGTHDELMALGGTYHKMALKQGMVREAVV